MADPLFSSVVLVDPARAAAERVALDTRLALSLSEETIGSDPKRGKAKTGASKDRTGVRVRSGKPGRRVKHAVSALPYGTVDFAKLTTPSVVFELDATMSEERWAQIKTFVQKVVRVAEELPAKRQELAISKLAEVFLPDDLAPARGVLAADELAIRDCFLATFPCLTSQQIHEAAGHRSANPYATANRWKKADEIFAVRHRDAEYFPAFQFREGRPHPTIKAVLTALPDRMSPWQRALWFVSTNGWLDDRTPLDCLDNVKNLIDAAEHEGAEVVG